METTGEACFFSASFFVTYNWSNSRHTQQQLRIAYGRASCSLVTSSNFNTSTPPSCTPSLRHSLPRPKTSPEDRRARTMAARRTRGRGPTSPRARRQLDDRRDRPRRYGFAFDDDFYYYFANYSYWQDILLPSSVSSVIYTSGRMRFCAFVSRSL